MKIFRDISAIPEKYKNSVVVLGNFDGLHLGHRSIIEKARKIADSRNIPLTLMSFEPHPKEFLQKLKGNNRELAQEKIRIFNVRSKLSVIKSLNVEAIFLVRFNKEFSALRADEFIKDIIVNKLNAAYVITGQNFYFGKNRQGDKNLLAEKAALFGFQYEDCPQIMDDKNNIISSSAIRDLLNGGEVKKANKLLGQPYHIGGRVIQGNQQGRGLGFPTANIKIDNLFIPLKGVYAVKAHIYDKNSSGRYVKYNAIANIGIKPTFGISKPVLEIHVPDININLYGKFICAEFIDFIREEKKFSSLEELKKQIAKDCKQVKESIFV
ncbi:MAG: bifunctional riboflavin kinase/FAD synthetase [Rickettsiales bacterium]